MTLTKAAIGNIKREYKKQVKHIQEIWEDLNSMSPEEKWSPLNVRFVQTLEQDLKMSSLLLNRFVETLSLIGVCVTDGKLTDNKGELL